MLSMEKSIKWTSTPPISPNPHSLSLKGGITSSSDGVPSDFLAMTIGAYLSLRGAVDKMLLQLGYSAAAIPHLLAESYGNLVMWGAEKSI